MKSSGQQRFLLRGHLINVDKNRFFFEHYGLNERDLEDLTTELRPEMEFVLVESAEEVLARALEPRPAASEGLVSLPDGRGSDEVR